MSYRNGQPVVLTDPQSPYYGARGVARRSCGTDGVVVRLIGMSRTLVFSCHQVQPDGPPPPWPRRTRRPRPEPLEWRKRMFSPERGWPRRRFA